MTKEQAFIEVQNKVAELQDALVVLHGLHQDGNVGIAEWMDHMDEVMMDLSMEIFE